MPTTDKPTPIAAPLEGLQAAFASEFEAVMTRFENVDEEGVAALVATMQRSIDIFEANGLVSQSVLALIETVRRQDEFIADMADKVTELEAELLRAKKEIIDLRLEMLER